MIAEDQCQQYNTRDWVGGSDQYIWGQQCESINNQHNKTRVFEDLSGIYQLWCASARKIFINQRNILWQKTSDNIRIPGTGSVGAIDMKSVM